MPSGRPSRRTFLGFVASVSTFLSGCASQRDITSTPIGTSTSNSSPANTGTTTPTDTKTATETETATPTEKPNSKFDTFVGVEGTDFVVDGEPLFPFGSNHPELRNQSEKKRTRWFDQWLSVAPDLNVLRATAFGSGTKYPNPLQPRPGEYNERAFQRLDELICQAGQRGVRLILPLTNNWDWDGGMPQYVEWADNASEHDDFYTDSQIRTWYRDYVSYVLDRENTRTGVQYKDDPTIMMWELANEPYAEDLSNLVDWADEMSSYIKSVGVNQLVSTGMGGLGGPNFRSKFGSIYMDVNELPNIDAYSIHIWVDPIHLDLGKVGGIKTIKNHTENAHDELEMPIYAGEFGWAVDRTDNTPDSEEIEKRNEVFSSWFSTMIQEGTNGSLVWNLRHELEYSYVSEGNRYAVFPRDEGTPEIFADTAATFSDLGSGS